MRKHIYLLLLNIFISSASNLFAQKYAVHFTDKNDSPYSVERPEEFLSQRSIERRERYRVAVEEEDFPPNPQYIEALRELGAQIPFASRWLNCALISCPQSVADQIEQLAFVDEVIYVAPQSYGNKKDDVAVSKFSNKLEKEGDFKPIVPKNIAENYNYGWGYGQINQINGIPVHEQGFTGEGVLIAVLDAGFRNVNSLSVFSDLFTEERLVFAMDVANPGGNIYAFNIHTHGTNVLSCMSANAENSFVGTAPKASYALIRTEDEDEYLVECYNWAIGAEAADSIGADIINSSLSYSEFDDSSMDYTYAQMDGETPVATYAAQKAIKKGVFVTVSAGNSNGTSWPWVGSPADANNAATIGAVNSSGNIAYFSSIGPNGAGHPKPNTLAEGYDATVYNANNGSLNTASGTSFSSPITCGMYACLIQANPSVPPALLRDIVDKTGDRYPNHDDVYGYGIPDFASALESVLTISALEVVNIEINDSQGNNDGRLNPGETVNLTLSFHNTLDQTLESVTATISTEHSNVNFINNNADFGTFLPDETKIIDDAFSFTLNENATSGAVTFQIDALFSGEKEIRCDFIINIYETPSFYAYYAVHFTDKNNAPYSVDEPLAYLSQRAIDRRQKFGIAITEADFPANADYIESVRNAGAAIHSSSRWGNFALVYADDVTIDIINGLDFVEKTVYVKPGEGNYTKYENHPKWKDENFSKAPLTTKEDFDYGYTYDQIKQLNGVCVHENGYAGEGVLIGVLDSGFEHADIVDGFKHLFESGRIVMAENVVEPGKSVYETGIHYHGTHVLSCMGGYIEGKYVGTAPQASYALIRTEDVGSEYPIEEYFWMIGAEKADSLGVDIINTSLIYTTFDDPDLNHDYSEMDGKTAISSIAAKMAVERGIFVAASAGNSNGSGWPWVGTPADTPEVLTLGAIDIHGKIANFSSIGPNGAGDPKPNIVACGSGACIISAENQIGYNSGTSFSSPIACGMVACVIQATPLKTPLEILEAVEKSANRYPEHDIAYGYGAPNFCKALEILGVSVSIKDVESSNLIVYPNPVTDKLQIRSADADIRRIELFDVAGKTIQNKTVNGRNIQLDMKRLQNGIYFLKITYDKRSSETVKMVKSGN